MVASTPANKVQEEVAAGEGLAAGGCGWSRVRRGGNHREFCGQEGSAGDGEGQNLRWQEYLVFTLPLSSPQLARGSKQDGRASPL